MKKILCITLFLLSSIATYCQTDSIFKIASLEPDKVPTYVGGEAAMNAFIKKNINYPDHNFSGSCYVKFIIEKDGSIGKVNVLNGVKECPLCDKEAVRVVSMMPKWLPGVYNGKNVRTEFYLPIGFYLDRQ